MTSIALTLGACSDTSPKRRAAAGSAASSSSSASAQPVSAEQYPAALKTAFAPFGTALRAVGKEVSSARLGDRLQEAMQAGDTTIKSLRQIGPPPELAAEHTRLVDAVRRLELEVISAASGSSRRDVCTGSAALARLEKTGLVSEVRRALDAVAAKAPALKDALDAPAAPRASSRPANGHFVKSGSRTGRGRLSINNGGDSDALVKLRKGDKVAISVFVREGKKHTVSGVPDGTYEIFFATGSAWDSSAKTFGEDCRFQRFDRDLGFKTTRSGSLIRSSAWRVTLQPVAGGNAKTTDVDDGSFPED